MAPRRQQDNGHFSSDDKHISEKQTLTQSLKDKLRQSRQEGAPAHVIADLGKSHVKEKHELLKVQHKIRQKIVTDAVASSASVPNHQRTSPHSMWDLLRRYKTDHVQSTLPAHTHDNASPDPRIWKLGPLTLDPLAWHRFRYALGHHLLRHKASPYNEEAAQKLTVHFSVRALLHQVEQPTLQVDLLFYEDITPHELAAEINLSEKSPGDDGITNRMIQAAGPKFTKILHGVFSTSWVHKIQPAAWQMSLL